MPYIATTGFSIPNVGAWEANQTVNLDEKVCTTLLNRGLVVKLEAEKAVESPKEELKEERKSNKLKE